MRILHLSHHHGCLADFAEVGRRLGLDVESVTFDDGYNIGPERATRAWQRWKDRLNGADVVLVSDTAPLARIVLQHLDDFSGYLVVWVCNRFDYVDEQTNDCAFPDAGYYELFRKVRDDERVEIASYTPFEIVHARERGVDLGSEVIRPLGLRPPMPLDSPVPASVRPEACVLVPPYLNDRMFDLPRRCENFGVRAYCGNYAGAGDAARFRAVVHVPYAWSTFAFFEHLQNGMAVFVPSLAFFRELAATPGFFWPNMHDDCLDLAEWFAPEHDFLVRYDSWDDLGRRLQTTDLDAVRRATRSAALRHADATIRAWERLFARIAPSVAPHHVTATPASFLVVEKVISTPADPTPADPAPADPTPALVNDFAARDAVERLLPFRRYLDAHTAEASGDRAPAASRFDSFAFAFSHFARNGGRRVVELGTIRSFVHGGLEGCNSDDPRWWQPERPETWDWGAGCFSLLAAICLAPLQPEIHTVDSSSAHLERCKVVTAKYAGLFHYHASDSVEYLRRIAPGSIDLLYVDTGDMWPLEPVAIHQLEEARAVVATGALSPRGLVLIDDVRNATPARLGDATPLAKAKYALPYMLDNGFEVVFDGYQTVLAASNPK